MLPPTWQAMPDSRRMWPVSAVVVVLPLVPVTPIVLPFRNGRRQFQLADDGYTAGARCGQDVEIRRDAWGEHYQGPRRGRLLPFEAPPLFLALLPLVFHLLRGLLRLWLGAAVRLLRRSGPFRLLLLFCLLVPFQEVGRRKRLPHSHDSFNVVRANNAITKPAIQNLVIIFDSGQPSASK